MDREALFGTILKEVTDKARSRGNCIEEQEVYKAFEPLGLDNEQMQMVFDYLVKHKIGIGAPVDMDEYLTDEEKNYLQMYLDELDELEEFTDGQKRACIMRAMAGEEDSQAELINYYLKDVVEVARIYTGQGVLIEDLIGEGNLALTLGVTMLGSVETPDEVDGLIMGMVMKCMEELVGEQAENETAQNKTVNKVNKVADAATKLAEDLGRDVTVAELVEETRMSEKYIREAIKISGDRIEHIDLQS